MTATALQLRNYGVGFGEQVVLTGIELDLPARGMTVVVGPTASGKSTLLRTLAGLNDNHPSLAVWGEVTPAEPRPSMVVQHARFYLDTVRENLVSALPNRALLDQAEQSRAVLQRLDDCELFELAAVFDRDVVSLSLPFQRQLAVVRAAIARPAVLFADEIDAGLAPGAAGELVATLRRLARDTSVVFVTHNQRHALAAGGDTVFIAGGRIHERGATAEFFAAPRSELGRQFLRTGGCRVASPGTSREDLDERVEPTPAPPEFAAARVDVAGPRGFFWVRPGVLGGTPRPGLLYDLEDELAGLRRLHIDRLVTLEETETVSSDALARAEIRGHHFPIDDMDVPAVDDALALCGQIDRWLGAGERVAVHCRAGLGRTGTVLACQLIWDGWRARDALEALRDINPRCIQSDRQVEFLRIFELARNQNNQT